MSWRVDNRVGQHIECCVHSIRRSYGKDPSCFAWTGAVYTAGDGVIFNRRRNKRLWVTSSGTNDQLHGVVWGYASSRRYTRWGIETTSSISARSRNIQSVAGAIVMRQLVLNQSKKSIALEQWGFRPDQFEAYCDVRTVVRCCPFLFRYRRTKKTISETIGTKRKRISKINRIPIHFGAVWMLAAASECPGDWDNKTIHRENKRVEIPLNSVIPPQALNAVFFVSL
jgi:hypothetical protein